ncbi:MAG TPA: C/D box methylation guide ribonucleoprotein complex aNOP56 subunit [Chromatiaceae bacterium]|nr:C/D box methylation guide ribonucleoprotein complex aNOP56 subunit [Chromatiaceae bacterium]
MGLRCTVLELIFGILALDDESVVVDYQLFPKKPEEIAERLSRLGRGETLEEVFSLVKRLKGRGFNLFVFEHEASARNVRETLNVKTRVESPSTVGMGFRRDLASKAVELGFAGSKEDYLRIVRGALDLLARKVIREKSGRGDAYIMQAVHALDELNKTINLFYSRLREWYGLYFPELSDVAEEPEEYFKVIAEIGWRGNMHEESLSNLGLKEKTVKALLKALKTSIGAEINGIDLEEIRETARMVLSLLKLRRHLESYLDRRVKEVAPNLHKLAGPLLAAKLIAQAGGLEALSKMPASTIQVLGAEKALFRALRTGTKPPKHGVIFQHPLVRQSPRRLRGRISRTLAAKLAIAARVDAFTGKDISDRLKKELRQRVEEILQAKSS